MITLHDLGYTDHLETYRASNKLLNFAVGRIISEHKERYIVKTVEGEFEGEILGQLRFSAGSRKDFPAVGDWVAISTFDRDKVLIHHILPRKNTIERQAVGKFGETQIIASNVDYAFIVQAADRDFNVNRLERYLTICHASDVAPILVISKMDLIDPAALQAIHDRILKRITEVPILFISNETQKGYPELIQWIEKGKTYCLLGSSGVGKSTLLNNLVGAAVMPTHAISEHTHKGRHVTTHRQLFVLEQGGLLIDNPGMREVGIGDVEKGLDVTFAQIVELSASCKYTDCTHVNEAGCAVIAAVEQGTLEQSAYAHYLKLEREQRHYEMDVLEKRKKDKQFGKMVKQYKKDTGRDK